MPPWWTYWQAHGLPRGCWLVASHKSQPHKCPPKCLNNELMVVHLLLSIYMVLGRKEHRCFLRPVGHQKLRFVARAAFFRARPLKGIPAPGDGLRTRISGSEAKFHRKKTYVSCKNLRRNKRSWHRTLNRTQHLQLTRLTLCQYAVEGAGKRHEACNINWSVVHTVHLLKVSPN